MSLDLLVVVPARGGSKRAPRKNIRPLAGVPLLVLTLRCAEEAGLLPQVVVSTDDAEIADVARQAGAAVLDRPAELATDTASTEGVLLHAAREARSSGREPAWVMTLPPASPFRRPETLRFFADAAPAAGVDCLMSVTENRGDFWRAGAGRFERLFPDAPRRQQDREPLFEENSAVYLTRASALAETGSVLGRSRRGVVIDPLEGYDINTEHDFRLAEAIVSAGLAPSMPARMLA